MTLKDKEVLDEGKPSRCPLGHTWQDEKDINGTLPQEEGSVVYRCAVCGRREEYKRDED